MAHQSDEDNRLRAFEAALASLTPRGDRLARDRLMFLAGQASARRGTVLVCHCLPASSARRRGTLLVSKQWHTAVQRRGTRAARAARGQGGRRLRRIHVGGGGAVCPVVAQAGAGSGRAGGGEDGLRDEGCRSPLDAVRPSAAASHDVSHRRNRRLLRAAPAVGTPRAGLVGAAGRRDGLHLLPRVPKRRFNDCRPLTAIARGARGPRLA